MTGSEQTRTGTAGPSRRQAVIAAATLAAIGVHLVLRFGVGCVAEIDGTPLHQLPLLVTILFGGSPLVLDLLTKLLRREFGSDLLAGLSIVTSLLLGEY